MNWILITFIFLVRLSAQVVSPYKEDFTGIIERNYNILKYGGVGFEVKMVNIFTYMPEDDEKITQKFSGNNLFLDWYFGIAKKIAIGFNSSIEYWEGNISKSFDQSIKSLDYDRRVNISLNNIDIHFPWLAPYIKFIRIGKQWLNYSFYILDRVWGLNGIRVTGKPFSILSYDIFYTLHKYSDYYTPRTFNIYKVKFSDYDDKGSTYGGKIDFLWKELKILRGAKFTIMYVGYNENLEKRGKIRTEDTIEGDFGYSIFGFNILTRYIKRNHIEYFENDGFGNLSKKIYDDYAIDGEFIINRFLLFDKLTIDLHQVGKDFIPYDTMRWVKAPPYYTADYIRKRLDRGLVPNERGFNLFFEKQLTDVTVNFRIDQSFLYKEPAYKYEYTWNGGIKRNDMYIFEIFYYFYESSIIYQYKQQGYYKSKSIWDIKESQIIIYNTFRFVHNFGEHIKINLGAVIQEGYFDPQSANWTGLKKEYFVREFFTLTWNITKKVEFRLEGSVCQPNTIPQYISTAGWREGPNFISETSEWYGDYYDNFIRIGLFSSF